MPLPISSLPLVGIVVRPVPPLVTGKAALKFALINVGFIRNINHSWLGLPVTGSKKLLNGMLMLLLGIAVAISYPLL